jgi:CheY-like chemotaxis protein
MDVSMPEMNGLEATSAIRALGLMPVQPVLHALRVPIIGVSAHAMTGDREACIAAGMDDYVTKPIQRDILLTKIAKYVA